MGFYKIAGGIKEYNSKDISNEDIPLDTPFVFNYEKRYYKGTKIKGTAVLVPRETDGAVSSNCKNCFFSSIFKYATSCPACMFSERGDGKDVVFLVSQML